MNASGDMSSQLIGYLAFVEFAAHGIVGGYLLVNQQARPVEFHCTTPIRASRTQEILYGSTLRNVSYYDQIGSTLLAQASQRPQLVLTDQHDALRLLTSEVPIAVPVVK